MVWGLEGTLKTTQFQAPTTISLHSRNSSVGEVKRVSKPHVEVVRLQRGL